MPISKWDQWVGPAAFIDGWLNQDPVEQKLQMDQLEGITSSAGRLTQIQGMQATERRTEAMFPGQQQLQQQDIARGGFEIEGLEREEELQQELDVLAKQHLGMSFKAYQMLSAAGDQQFANLIRESRTAEGVPGLTGTVESGKLKSEVATQEAEKRVDLPRRRAEATAQEAVTSTATNQYQQLLSGARIDVGMHDILVNTEAHLARLAPFAKVMDIHQSYASAVRDMGAYRDTPAGKEQAMRMAWNASGLSSQFGSFDDYLVRDMLRKNGDWQKPGELTDNIQAALGLQVNLMRGDASDAAVQGWLMANAKDNPELLMSIQMEKNNKEGMLQGINRYINVNKNLLQLQGIDYDALADRERNYTETDIERIIGAMAGDPSRRGKVVGFRTDKPDNVKRFLARLMNEMDAGQWEKALTLNRAALVDTYSQEDWQFMMDIVRYSMWDIGKIAGTARPPQPGVPGRPPQAAHLSTTPEGERIPEAEKRMTLPLVPLQKQEAGLDMLQSLMESIEMDTNVDDLEEMFQTQFETIMQETSP